MTHPLQSKEQREIAARLDAFRHVLARIFWRGHLRLTGFLRHRTARILLLCEIAALLLAHVPTLEPAAFLLALIAVASLFFLISVSLLAALCGLLLLGAGFSASVVTINVAEQLAASAYYVFLVIVARQLFTLWLAHTVPGRTMVRLGARVEHSAYENLRDLFSSVVVAGMTAMRRVAILCHSVVVAGMTAMQRVVIVALTMARATFRFVRQSAVIMWTGIGWFFSRAALLCLSSVLSAWDAVQQARFGTRRKNNRVAQSGTRDLIVSRAPTTSRIRVLRQRRVIRALGHASHIASGWFAKIWFPLCVVALFAVPFFWFRHGEGDFGGDSSRLYFYDPLSWLTSLGLFEVNVGGYGREAPNFFLIPFLLLLQGIKVLLFSHSALLLPFFNGLLLVMAFASVYAIIRDLHIGREAESDTRFAALLGASFFIFSHIIIYNWQKYLYTFHQVGLYPLLVWIFLRYLKRERWVTLMYGLLLTFVFSVNFSAYTAQSLFSFFPFAGVLLAAYAGVTHKVRALLKGLLVFFLLAVFLHAFHLLPQVHAVLQPENALYQNIFTPHGKLVRGLGAFEGLRAGVRLLYNLVGFHQYSVYQQTGASPQLLALMSRYGVKTIALFMVFPLTVVLGLFFSIKEGNRKIRLLYLAAVSLFAVALFFMTANLFGALGPFVYGKLFSLPGFAMFRNFYGVFAIVFMFVYAVAFGMSLRLVLSRVRQKTGKIAIAGSIGALLLYAALPFFSGQIANSIIADTNGVKLSNRFSSEFEEALAWVRQSQLDGKVLTLPLTAYDYQIIDGAYGGAYVGPSPLAHLANKHVFSGLASFDSPGPHFFTTSFFTERFQAHDVRTLSRMFSLLNIGLIFYNDNPSVYRGAFLGWPYSKEIFDLFPDGESIRQFIERLGYREAYARGSYKIFTNPNAFFPHLYSPRSVIKGSFPARTFGRRLFSEKTFDLEDTLILATGEKDEVLRAIPETVEHAPRVEFRKINGTRYRVRLHQVRNGFPLVFSEMFHRGWRLIPTTVRDGQCGKPQPEQYSLRQVAQASADDIEAWCAQGLLSATGPDFISQAFHGVMQNQNLPTGALWETWRLPALEEKYHLRANEYANAWWVDLDYLQKQFPHALKAREGGGFDLELVLEFTPQRFFYLGTVISLVTLVGIGVFIVWSVFARLRWRNAG